MVSILRFKCMIILDIIQALTIFYIMLQLNSLTQIPFILGYEITVQTQNSPD